MMKIKVVCSLFFLLCFGNILAQDKASTALPMSAFTKGNTYISGGYGLINANFMLARTLEKSLMNGWDQVNFSKVPNIYAKGEYALSNHVGLGLNVATGGLIAHVAIDSVNNQNVRIAGDLTYRSWSALARINYHALNSEKWDLYLGVGVGFRMNTVKVTSNDPITDRWDFPVNLGIVERKIPNSSAIPSLGADLTMGLAYQLSPSVSLYTEAGIAKSALQAGLRVGF
jgi:hypothetical protein